MGSDNRAKIGNADTAERIKELLSAEGFIIMKQSRFWYTGWMISLFG